MIKKLRRRFIAVGMAAFTAVALILILSINVVNYYRTTAGHDEVLQGIRDYNAVAERMAGSILPPITDMSWAGGPGSEFTLRFFTIRCNESGELLIFNADYISSIDEETAGDYARAVLDKHQASGFYESYRYLVTENEDDIEIIFLNVADANQYRRTLLVISLVIGGIGLVLGFVLILLFSGYAIRPYVKNLTQQKQFITDAGHELKTPVTSIATSADILAMDYEGNEWVENIRSQSVRLTKLISDLVLLSRLDEEQPFPETEDFSLSDAAWELAESFAFQAEGRGKHFAQEIDGDVTFRGDQTALRQLISILLDNALRYSDEGGSIRFFLGERHGHIVIEVYNTCGSVPDIDLNRLFDRFYRPDASRSQHTGGSGIGLSIARAVAERHGGSITAATADGRSMTFTVTLPGGR